MFTKLDDEICKDVLCTSGTNYIVVQSDGKIHRCFKDLNTLCDVWSFPNGLLPNNTKCASNYSCDASSDQMFCYQTNAVKKKDFCPTNPVARISPNGIYAVVYLTNKCNFNCPYCCNYYPQGQEDKRPICPEISTEDWIQFFSKLKKPCQIQFNGGEPLLRKDFDVLLSHCSEFDEVSIVSNFSVSSMLDKIIDIPFPSKVFFNITLHPINKNFDFATILYNILRFKNKGFGIRITLLGWPENKVFHEHWKHVFKDLGIPYWFKWCGGYDYSQEFIRYLCQEGAGKTTAEYLSQKKEVVQKDEIQCTAGNNYFVIDIDGIGRKCWHYPDKMFDLDNYKQYNFDNNNFSCSEIKCIPECEGAKVEIWKNKKPLWKCMYWKKPFESMENYKNDTLFLQLDFVYGCVNGCPYCYIDKKNTNQFKFIDSKKIIEFLKYMSGIKPGDKYLNICGSGEQLLHPDFVDIVDNATNLGYGLEIITSGLVNTEKLFELSNKEKILLIISVHPLSKNWNFEKIDELLQKLKKEKFKYVSIVFVKYPENMKYYNDLKQMASQHKIQMDELDYRPKNV